MFDNQVGKIFDESEHPRQSAVNVEEDEKLKVNTSQTRIKVKKGDDKVHQ